MRNAITIGVVSWCVCTGAAAAPPATHSTAPGARIATLPGVRGTRQVLFDAWLASDAVVVATYGGVDSARGPAAHTADVDLVWAGTPARGPLWFKAPRGIAAARGDRAILFLWDRLAGAPDAYLEEAKSRYGDRVWQTIGPDSTTAYLLPFATYAYKLDDGKLVLRGHRAVPTTLSLGQIESDILDWESQHTPQALFQRAAVVLRAHVDSVAIVPRIEQGILIERRVKIALRKREVLKGAAPDPLRLEFMSFPRAPRFRAGDEVIVFLSQGADGLFFEFGKRGVFHLVAGEAVEAGRPVAEFIKSLQPAR